MARIAGVNIPSNKRVEVALTYIHGIGDTFARQICTKVSIPPERRVSQLTESEIIQAAQAGILRFARLVGDDRVHLEPRHDRLLVRPAASLAGLIEVL